MIERGICLLDENGGGGFLLSLCFFREWCVGWYILGVFDFLAF